MKHNVLKSLLMKGKEESKKAGLKLSIQKTKIMESSLLTSWQIEGERVRNFIFLGSKITADGDCSHGIKRCLLLGRKAMTNLDSILKSRDITLPTKAHLVKAMLFSNRKEMRKSKMAVWGGLTKAVKRREAKSKGEKERYKHLNAEFQE